MSKSEDVGKGIKSVLDIIQKKFGKESIVGELVEIERVSSGCLSLDLALGGGFPKGRILEFMGWEASAKTSGALHLAAEVQKLGKRVAYVDVEHSLDLFYAANLGVNVDITAKDPQFVLSQPNDGETAMGIVREFANSGEFGLIVVDSVSSLVPKALINGEVGDQKMGVIARLMSSWVPALVAPANRTGCIIVFISQYREKIGIVYGSNVTTSGGNALKFYASIRLEFARVGQIKDGDEVLANKTRVKVLKNKVSVPFKQAHFNVVFGIGIDKVADILDLAVDLDIVKKSGSWYSYGDVKLGQGSQGVTELLRDNLELLEEIEGKLKKELNL